MEVTYSQDRKIAYCDGFKFRLDSRTGYYLCTKSTYHGHRERLHVYIWRKEHGEIPEGYHVHHVDGDKNNNRSDNLTCISGNEHSLHHMQDRVKNHREVFDRALEKARPKAAEWHKSEQGREWHRLQYKKTEERFHAERDFICLVCGKPFKSTKAGSKFCSNNCKATARRRSGVDNETRICAVCGNQFTTNKYSKARTCSRGCRNKLFQD